LPPAAPPRAVQPLAILLIEDEEASRMFARVLLERLGQVVTEAATAGAALERARRQRFDLILLDLGLPDMDGAEVARALLTGEGPSHGARIVAVSARIEGEDRAGLTALGVESLIAKPLTAPKLKALLGAPAAGPAPGPTIDRAALDEHRMVLGGDRMAHVIDQFLTTLTSAAAGLAAIDGLPELARLMHRLAGGASTLGLLGLADAAGRLEGAAKAGDATVVAEGRSEVAALLGRATRELTGYKAAIRN
jgi:CheY-like chemotaxis protein